MQYGYFNDITNEYVITNPKTPVKWINYIGELTFGGFVDQTGGALLCKEDPALNRITKYIPQQPSYELKGESIYVRIKENNGYTLFSPFFTPTLDQYTMYECHIGLGYTRIISEFYGIRSDITIFVPRNEHREIRDVRITNLRAKDIQLDIIPIVEYTHFDALKQFTNADWIPQTMQSRCIEDKNGLKILLQYAFMNKDKRINFFTSNLKASSFETDRRRFLGDNEYGTYESPRSLIEEELGNYEALRGDNIAALMHHIGNIPSGESRRIIFQLGQCTKLHEELVYIEKYRNIENVDTEYEALKKYWENYLSKMQVNTPDKILNILFNVYTPRQCQITKNWSRALSLYQMGFGERGIGIRDLSQDIMGIMSFSLEESKVALRTLLSKQRIEGFAMHQFNPLNGEASAGDAREMTDRPQYYSDDHLWIFLAVIKYLKESGDIEFLSEEVPYYDPNSNCNTTTIKEAVIEHLKRGIEFTYNNVGIHGLPYVGFADWLDPINLKMGAESVFTACLFGKVLLEIIELCEAISHVEGALKYKAYYEVMKDRVDTNAWDESWYISYFDEKGQPLGSKKNEKGKIFVHVQGWSIISGFAKGKEEQVLQSVRNMLSTVNGIKVTYPSYNGYEENKGGITTYPPGAKENGGIFLHCNPWIIIAETLVGHGEIAYEYYNNINPLNKNNKIETYESEPYCYAQNILGDEHQQFGLGRNSWLSGTASWAYQGVTEYILGIRASFNGIIVDPCIPKEWKVFQVKKWFRGAIYHISVENTAGINKGVKIVIVDDKEIEGNIIPEFCDGKSHEVTVIMGIV